MIVLHCRISPPRFLAKCRKRRLNQGSFVLLFFRLFTLSDLYLVFACLFPVLYLYLVSVCLFSCTAFFVSISQVTGCEDCLRNGLLCVGWGVKLYSLTHSLTCTPLPNSIIIHLKQKSNYLVKTGTILTCLQLTYHLWPPTLQNCDWTAPAMNCTIYPFANTIYLFVDTQQDVINKYSTDRILQYSISLDTPPTQLHIKLSLTLLVVSVKYRLQL